jgi:hypothetical protein
MQQAVSAGPLQAINRFAECAFPVVSDLASVMLCGRDMCSSAGLDGQHKHAMALPSRSCPGALTLTLLPSEVPALCRLACSCACNSQPLTLSQVMAMTRCKNL